MTLDTHAAFRQLENSGFDTKQAEALVQVINGTTGEQATKEDIKEVREDFKDLREEFKDLREEFKEFKDEMRGEMKEFREEVKAALKEQGDRFEAALKEQGDKFQAALNKQGEDFKERFATKTDVAVAIYKTQIATLAVAALLFAAIQLFS